MYSFKCCELQTIFATTPSNWIETMHWRGVDIFEHQILVLPFASNGQKSLFVIINATDIRTYHNKSHKGSRPCILHLDPNEKGTSTHDYGTVSERLRVWLNCMWRKKHNDNNPLSMPFNKRSMPLCRPSGKSNYIN